jgi:hypothetical protein
MACANEIISLKLHAAPNTPQPPALPTRGFLCVSAVSQRRYSQEKYRAIFFSPVTTLRYAVFPKSEWCGP